jgi:hypothetical protein
MPCKRVSHSIGALVGNLGFNLPGHLGEKKIISGFLSWTWWPLKFEIWGPSGTLVKEQGSPELMSDYGTQRDCL